MLMSQFARFGPIKLANKMSCQDLIETQTRLDLTFAARGSQSNRSSLMVLREKIILLHCGSEIHQKSQVHPSPEQYRRNICSIGCSPRVFLQVSWKQLKQIKFSHNKFSEPTSHSKANSILPTAACYIEQVEVESPLGFSFHSEDPSLVFLS